MDKVNRGSLGVVTRDHEWWTTTHERLPKQDRKCFNSLVILMSWIICLERNRRTHVATGYLNPLPKSTSMTNE